MINRSHRRYTAKEAEQELAKIVNGKDDMEVACSGKNCRGVKDDEITTASVLREANELMTAIDAAETPVVETAGDDDVKEVMASIRSLSRKISAAEKKDGEIDAEDDEKSEVLKTCKDLEKKIGCTAADDDEPVKACNKKASVAKRIAYHKNMIAKLRKADFDANNITDTAFGDEGPVQNAGIVDCNVDTDSTRDVFCNGSECNYVASITKRLDRVASALENRGMKRMAFRIDQLSDALEKSARR